MEKDTKVVVHKGTSIGTGFFFTNAGMGKGIVVPYP